MQSKFTRSAMIAAAVMSVIAVDAEAQYAPLPAAPIAKDDIVYGTNNSSAVRSLKQAKADLGVRDSGNSTTLNWTGGAFMQSVEFDNLNGIRHNAGGNLLALNFGTTAAGGSISTFATNGITAGQTTAAAGSSFFAFDGNNGTEIGRIGGLSVSPNNTRLAVTSGDFGPTADKRGKIAVVSYTAAASNGTGASASNYHSLEIPGLRVGTVGKTTGTSWLDSNDVMVIGNNPDLSTTGDLYKVAVAADGSLSSTKVAENLFQNFDPTFNSIAYEPTVSPYMFIAGSGFSGSSFNKLVVVDPRNNFAPVTPLLDFSPTGAFGSGNADGQVGTSREISLDSKGNLLIGAFFGSTALSDEYAFKTLMNAKDVATLSSNSTRLVGILRKYQTSDATTTTASTATPPSTVINGTSTSFSGSDVALTNVDYINTDVTVNIGTGDYVQQYFGTSPESLVVAKLKAGTIKGTTAAGKAVGYSFTPGTGGGSFRLKYTLLGDANLTGNVNFDDLIVLAQNYNTTGKNWSTGDFTYDGVVNFDDLIPLAQNYGQALTPLQAAELGSSFASDWAAALSLVPEPTSLAALASLGLVLRRNRAKA